MNAVIKRYLLSILLLLSSTNYLFGEESIAAQTRLVSDLHDQLETIKSVTLVRPKAVMAQDVGAEFKRKIEEIGDAIQAEQKQVTKEEQDKLAAAKEAIENARKEMAKQIALIKSSSASESDKLKSIEMVVTCIEKIQTEISIAGAAFTVLSQLQGHSGRVFAALGFAPVGVAVQIVGPFVTNLAASIHTAAQEQDVRNAAKVIAAVKLKNPALQQQVQTLQAKMAKIEQGLSKGCVMLGDVIEGVTGVKDKAVALMKEAQAEMSKAAKAVASKLGLSKFTAVFQSAEQKRIEEAKAIQEPEFFEPAPMAWDSSLVPKMIATATQTISDFNDQLDSINPITRIANGNELVTALIALNNTKQGKILGNKIISGFDLTIELMEFDLVGEEWDLFFEVLDNLRNLLQNATTTKKPGLLSKVIYLDPAKNHLKLVKDELIKFVTKTIPMFMGILTSDPDEYVIDYTQNMANLKKFVDTFRQERSVAAPSAGAKK